MGDRYVRLARMVRSDFPFSQPDSYAPPGVYLAHVNPQGAVSVVAMDGELLGVLPDEFEWCEASDVPSKREPEGR